MTFFNPSSPSLAVLHKLRRRREGRERLDKKLHYINRTEGEEAMKEGIEGRDGRERISVEGGKA